MKVLIPVDDYLFSTAIINFIANHKWQDNVSFHVMHVIEPIYFGSTPDVAYLEIMEQSNSLRKDRASELVANTAKSIATLFPKTTVTSEVYHGDIKEIILSEIQIRSINLVISGSHGARGFKRFFLGSVSLALVATAPCSVLIVKPSTYLIDKWESMSETAKLVTKEYLAEPIEQKPLTVLLAVEENYISEYVLKVILDHQWLDNTTFKLIHVVESPMIGSPMAATMLLNEASDTAIEASKKLLSIKAKSIKTSLPKVTVLEEVLEGGSKEAILEHAKNINADLIILGSHGKSALERIFIGSVSLAVLSTSSCSTLVIKPPKQ